MQLKSEQFRDTLGSYADRMASIVEDELSDVHFLPSSESSFSDGDGDSASPPWYNFGQLVEFSERAEVNGAHHHVQQQTNHFLPKWETQNGLRGW